MHTAVLKGDDLLGVELWSDVEWENLNLTEQLKWVLISRSEKQTNKQNPEFSRREIVFQSLGRRTETSIMSK